jgi:orotidine-5'-phosphate decarboxylase
MKRKTQLILALDVNSLSEAKTVVGKLYPAIKIFKVGIQLFTEAGPKIVDFIIDKGAEVFLDLKFFDIPNTVANAVRQAVRMKVKMLTMHILGDEEMLKLAVRAAEDEAGKFKLKRPLLIGVTVLTSKDAESSDVLTLARIGRECGLDGVVCSVREARKIKQVLGKDFLVITPGIRPKGCPKGDQVRVATAQEAKKAGADFIVVGRPILEAKDPLKVIRELE